jgi:thiol-disulfide isomerase/thioredoxin
MNYKSLVLMFALLGTLLFSCVSKDNNEVTISGRVFNVDNVEEKIEAIEIFIYYPDPINRTMHRSEIDKNSNFNFHLKLDHPQDLYLKLNNKAIKLLAQPGKDLNIKIDAKKYLTSSNRYETVTFSGQGSNINCCLAEFLPKLKDVQPSPLDEKEKNENLPPSEYKKFRITQLEKEMYFLNNYLEQHEVPELFKVWAKYHIEYNCSNLLMFYSILHMPLNELRSINFASDSYFTFLDDFEVENPHAIMCTEYCLYLNNFCLQSLKKNQWIPDVKAIFGIILEQGSGLNQNDRKRLRSLSDKAPEIWTEEESAFTSKIFESHQELTEDLQAQMNIKKLLSQPDGLVFDVILATYFSSLLETRSSLDIVTKYLDTFKTRVKNESIKNTVCSLYDEVVKRDFLLSPEANIFSTPVNAGDSLLIDIMKKYKGKVVYLDFWATWCPPCKSEMPHSIKLEHELKDKDIKFVYICIDSPEKDRLAYLSKNKFFGDHYTATYNQYSIFRQRFRISGVPHYMIINQNGIVVDRVAESPSTGESIKKDLLTVLEKQEL